ncbi:MAG TPA: SDR family oxidoreductase [Chitinophagaceae bacterium]|nr:SDR family oxidoreductase [Chitinophagaceae bacterium]
MNIVITGASRGIGKAVAEIFAANGHNLYLSSRSDVALFKTTEELSKKYPSVVIKAKPFDLSIKERAQQFGSWCLQQAVPDILVNNAGLFEPGSVFNEPDGVLESQIATNLYSAYHVTRRVVPKMIESTQLDGLPRHVFNMCSIASLDAYPNGGAYSISKFALYGFSKNLRNELKEFGIKVTAVLPGAVMTDSWEGFDNSTNRIMETTDVAKMIYAASQLSLQACVEDIIIRPQLGDL